MREDLERYIELNQRVCELSSPSIDQVKDAEEYRVLLQRSFEEIGKLAKESEQILQQSLYPLLQAEVLLHDEQVELLHDFFTLMLNATDMESRDLPVVNLQAERLVAHAEETGDVRARIRALDTVVMASYAMMCVTQRLYPCFDFSLRYRDRGIDAAEQLIGYLEPERFAALPDDECREIVLINSRYVSAMFDWPEEGASTDRAEYCLSTLRRALALPDIAFYREQAPDYDWTYHTFRTLQYLTCLTDDSPRHQLSPKQLREVVAYTERFLDYLHTEMPEMEQECPEPMQRLYLLRNRYLAEDIPFDVYKAELRALMELRDTHDCSTEALYVNFVLPYEYILTMDREAPTKEDEEVIRTVYNDLAGYIYRLPKTGDLSFVLTFLADLLRHYIEIPGVPDFETMCLNLLAALHPTSYIHTLSVAGLMQCLTAHLLDRRPDLFVGVLGARDAAEAAEKREEILAFAKHAALMHDVGKLFVIETILTYGRNLLDDEFTLIGTHPTVGACFLELHPDTKSCAEIARGHHRWFDNSAGYPHDFDMEHAENKTLIALLTVADCLDASTDMIGRNYKESITLDAYIAEVQAESGTRYAPYLAELLGEEEVRRDLQAILDRERDENYRKTYELLKSLQ